MQPLNLHQFSSLPSRFWLLIRCKDQAEDPPSSSGRKQNHNARNQTLWIMTQISHRQRQDFIMPSYWTLEYSRTNAICPNWCSWSLTVSVVLCSGLYFWNLVEAWHRMTTLLDICEPSCSHQWLCKHSISTPFTYLLFFLNVVGKPSTSFSNPKAH